MDSAAAPPRADVTQLHALAVQQYNVGTPARALRTLHRALGVLDRRASDFDPRDRHALSARIWISIALNETEVRSVDRGIEALAKAEEYATLAVNPAVDVLLHCQRGLIELRAGHPRRSLAALDEAARLIEHAEPRDQSTILLNRGALHLAQGELGPARSDLRRAAEIARISAGEVGEFKALHNLGYLEFLRGDLPLALRSIDQANRLPVDVSRGVLLLDRARVLTEAGLTLEADAALAEATALFRHERRTQDLGEADIERARCALIGGDLTGARSYAGRARDRFRRLHNDRWRRSAELALLQADLAAGRPGRRLAPHGLRLRDEFEETGLRLLARTAAMLTAEAYVSAGDLALAADVLATVPRAGRKDPITVRMHDCLVRARLHAAQGETRVAAQTVRSGLRQLGAYQASFGSIDLQTAAAVHGRQLAELGVALALDGGRPTAVLAAAEHARAASSRMLPVRPPADVESAELLAELRQTVESLGDAMQGRDAEPLLAKRRELERQITAHRWSLAGTGDVQPVAPVGQITDRLAATDSTMVVLVEAQGQLHAVVLDAGRLRLHALGPAGPTVEQVRRVRADLDVLSRPHLVDAMRAAVRASFEASMAQLNSTLLAPLRIDGRRLVIISAGLFGHLPWGSLPSLRGVPVVLAPSATAWLAAAEPTATTVDGVIALAGPDLDRADHEVLGIQGAWPGSTVHTGRDADRDAIATAMAKGRIVHIAAHGVHQTENPLFSSLQLVDGPLFAHELDQTARTPEHVVLSACELGLATVRPGDEALGLTSVLLHLGTRSVVAGVARVNDEVAAETMIAYHRRLAAGSDSATALAGALEYIGGEQCAPFVCFGAAWSDADGRSRAGMDTRHLASAPAVA